MLGVSSIIIIVLSMLVILPLIIAVNKFYEE